MRWLLALWLIGCSPTTPLPAASSSPLPSASPSSAPFTPSSTPEAPCELWTYEVVARYPHDPEAYTQGLWMDPQGQLWETTGLRKQSTFRKVDLKTGKFQVLHRLPDKEFGEGLAFSQGKYFWLTWDTQVCHSYDAHLKPLKDFRYEGEGWGLCADNSGDLWMSNGSSKLVLRDAKSFEVKREIEVLRQGQPQAMLNELEWVEGKIYANVYGTPGIAVIDPQQGRVEAWIDFSGLLSPAEAEKADVFNGIAYRADTGQFWVTGKKWPRLYEVKIRKGP